jgi:hypothetical protein
MSEMLTRRSLLAVVATATTGGCLSGSGTSDDKPDVSAAVDPVNGEMSPLQSVTVDEYEEGGFLSYGDVTITVGIEQDATPAIVRAVWSDNGDDSKPTEITTETVDKPRAETTFELRGPPSVVNLIVRTNQALYEYAVTIEGAD